MKSDSLLLIVAIIAVTISLAGTWVSYNSITNLQNMLTGYATATGTINLSIESGASINFTTNIINWGSGRVNTGQDNATLDTSKRDSANITNGNWTSNTAGLIIENIGNVNVSLDLAATKNATNLTGGTAGGGPQYMWNVSNNETGSCLNTTGAYNVTFLALYGQYNKVNTTTRFCNTFTPYDSTDEIRIDIKLVVPSDSSTGALSDIITATATAI